MYNLGTISLVYKYELENYIILGGGCMSESDISDISDIENINNDSLKGGCFYELQPRNSKRQI
jgi:hypothetical protein